MNNKRLHQESKIADNKRRRSLITFEMKLDIVKRYESKERSCDIARSLNLSQSTVRTILIQSDKIKERSKRLASLSGTRFLRPRSNTIENMEKRLAEWIKYETDRNNPVSFTSIKEKAKDLYETIRVELNDVEAKPFVASHGWLDRFKKRMKLFKLNTGEEPQTTTKVIDMEVVDGFPKIFQDVVDKGGYSPKQVFSLYEFGLFWRRLPSRENDIARTITEKERVTVSLCANALGDCKLKPLVIYRHSRDPVALKGYSRDHLPVIWRYNSKGEMSFRIFSDYFCNRFTNELKDYCLKENIPFKILLLIERNTAHPQYLEDFSENIKVLFLPPNTSNWLHPMYSDVVNSFKINYLHSIFSKIIDDMYADGGDSIEDYRLQLTIKDAIDCVGLAWSEVDQSTLKAVWYKMWPIHAGEYKCFELTTKITAIGDKIIALAKDVGIENDVFYIMQFLRNHPDELTSEELEQLKEEGDDAECEDEDYGIRTLSSDDIFEAFQHIRAATTIFDENDYNRERSFKVIRNLEAAIECYKQIYNEKRRNEPPVELSEVTVKIESPDDGELDFSTTDYQVDNENLQ